METIQAGMETFFDSPGDLLAVLSIVALLGTGILFLIDARIGTIKQLVIDMKEENTRVHDDIRESLAAHAASPAHNRRRGDA